MHDGGVEPRGHGLVQEHGVEHLPRGGVQAEGDVRQAERRLDVRVQGLQLPDRLDRLDAVPAGLLLAGGDGEGEGVDEDVAHRHAPVPGQVADEAVGHAHLPLGRARLALLVDRQGHDPGTVLHDERHDAVDPGVRPVAVLVVDRVDDGPAAEHLQTCLEHRGLGRVEDDRERRGRREAPRQLLHVGHAVAADVVDAEVEQVGAVADLVARDLHAVVPPLLQHGLAEGLRSVGVGALADGQVRRVLAERHCLVERRRRRLGVRLARSHLAAADAVHDVLEMLGRRPAASTDEGQAELAGEHVVRVRELGRAERVVGAVGGEHRQAGIGHGRDADARRPGQRSQVLAHLRRAGGAVESDHVDAQRRQRGERGADLRAQQHRPGGLDGDLGEDRQGDAGLGEGTLGPDDGRLGLEEVLGGLDQDGVGAAGDEAGDLLLVGVTQHGVGGVAQAGQLGSRPDRPQHPPRVGGGRPVVGHPAGDGRAGLRELEDALRDRVLAEVREVRAEGVGLDAVDPDGEVGVVDAGDQLGPGHVEDLVAALVPLEVVQ